MTRDRLRARPDSFLEPSAPRLLLVWGALSSTLLPPATLPVHYKVLAINQGMRLKANRQLLQKHACRATQWHGGQGEW